MDTKVAETEGEWGRMARPERQGTSEKCLKSTVKVNLRGAASSPCMLMGGRGEALSREVAGIHIQPPPQDTEEETETHPRR